MTETATAKINLALHVVARRTDGYHVLDSLVAFAGIGDRLIFEPAAQLSLEITGPFSPQLTGVDDNIVLAAAQAVQDAFPAQVAPCSIKLEKNLPVASGIGGGSADAAGVLRGLVQAGAFQVDELELNRIAAQLGADVPVCLAARTCRMRGIGDDLYPVDSMPGFPAVLVNPKIPVSTPEVFAQLTLAKGESAYDELPEVPQHSHLDRWLSWLSACRNDLQAPAIALVPEIATVLSAIVQTPGCVFHRMSGSGATCFGLYENRQTADDAARNISAQHPNWWVCPTSIG